MNREEAIKASRQGAYAAFVSCGLTILFFIFAVSRNASEGLLGFMNDWTVIWDVAIAFVCGIFLLRNSRAAAVIALLQLVLSKLYIAAELGGAVAAKGLLVTLIFLYYYAKAIQGTFTFHKIEKAENPNYKPTRKWILWTAIPIAMILLALTGLGMLTSTGVLPSTQVLPGDKIASKHHKDLLEAGLIGGDETIEYFYSNGFSSVLESGNVLTDRRVIRYGQDESGEVVVYELAVAEIASVDLIEQGGGLSDSIYQVNSDSPDEWLQIVLSVENGGDRRFVEALKQKMRK